MNESQSTLLELTLTRDRRISVGGLVAVIGVSWIWIATGAGMNMDALEMARLSKPLGLTAIGNESGSGSAHSTIPLMLQKQMMRPVAWNGGYALLMFSMWWIMMVAMMLPSASPTLLLFARLSRKEKARGRPFVPTGMFATGYLLAWGGFSAVATLLQWALESTGLISSMMVSSNAWPAVVLLFAAGAWQLTPIKQACLRHCRSPLAFLSQRWRNGPGGAVLMGLEHGAFCLGCCWFLMGLLFYGGVMNLYWIIGLAAFVLVEKLSPVGVWLGKLVGIGLLAWGAAILIVYL